MATTMSDLPWDLVENILTRVPLTSLRAVRFTCKTWNVLSKNQIFGKTEQGKRFMGFMVMDSKLCSMEFDLQGLQNDGHIVEPSINQVSIYNQVMALKVPDWEWDGHLNSDLVDPSIKQARILNQPEMCEVFHWDGLLLCVIKDKRWRLVWNPYLGQIRWIQPINKPHRYFHEADIYALGYDNNNRNHKILRLVDVFKCSYLPPFFELYDFYSNSWRVLDVNPTCHVKPGVSLNGNSYFLAQENLTDQGSRFFLLCFDFTTERFGQRIALPFVSCVRISKTVTLSCVRDEKVAVLHQGKDGIMEIYITTKIEPNAATWSRFIRARVNPGPGVAAAFFIDEEKKAIVVSSRIDKPPYQRAYIIRVHGSSNYVNIGKARKPGSEYFNQLVFSSYAPSLVQLQINRRGKRKERDY